MSWIKSAIQVSGGTLIFQNPPSNPAVRPYFIVKNGTSQTEYQLGELRYVTSDGEATVTLENGAVHIRYWSSPNGSAMLSTPSWYYDGQTGTGVYVIQMIRMNAPSNLAQTGIGRVQMQLSNATQQTMDVSSSDYIEYLPSSQNHYGVAWNNYLRSPGLMLTENTGKFYFKNNSKLVIKEYNVTFLSI